MIKLWWILHRGLVDPEIAATLSAAQQKQMYRSVVAARKWHIWLLSLAVAGLWVMVYLATPLGSFVRWLTHAAGPFASLPIPLSFGVISSLVFWWLSRRVFAHRIYQSLRAFKFDVCVRCGYWLRGLGEDVQRCPECGAQREPAPRIREGHS